MQYFPRSQRLIHREAVSTHEAPLYLFRYSSDFVDLVHRYRRLLELKQIILNQSLEFLLGVYLLPPSLLHVTLWKSLEETVCSFQQLPVLILPLI